MSGLNVENETEQDVICLSTIIFTPTAKWSATSSCNMQWLEIQGE